MKLRRYLLTVIMCTLISRAKAVDEDDFDEDEEDFSPMIGEKNDRFDWLLCSAMDQLQPTNIITSPISMKFMMVLLYEASTRQTASELQNALQLDNTRVLVRARYGALLKLIQAESPHYKLYMRSRMFLDKPYAPHTWYQNVLARDYDTYVQRLPLNKPDLAAKVINQWANEVTQGAINNLATEETIKGSQMVLVNAVYFKGIWQYPFSPKDSYTGLFASPEGRKPTRFMTQTELFYYSESEELDAQFIRLPYKGKKFAMYVALPRKTDGITNMLQKIRPFLLRRMIWQLEQNIVSVTLPIFKFESTLNVKEVLLKLGVRSLFEHYEDIIGFKTKKPRGPAYLKVSNIIQKATIDVTETGTVATAITETQFVNKIGFTPIIFNASRPFMFMIKDEETGTVIFQGKLVNPEYKTGNIGIPPVITDQEDSEQDDSGDVTTERYKPKDGGERLPQYTNDYRVPSNWMTGKKF